MVIFFIGCHGCGGIFCMGSFQRSYKYGKIRVRLMRMERDGNENEGHFVSVRRGSLRSRAEGGGVELLIFVV